MFTTAFFMIIPYFSLVLVFEALKKNSLCYKTTSLLCIFIATLIIITSHALTGSRGSQVYFIICYFLLVVSFFIQPKYKLSWIAVPFCIILIIYSLFWICVLPMVRCHKIDKIVTTIYEVFEKNGKIESSLKEVLVLKKEMDTQKIPLHLRKTNNQSPLNVSQEEQQLKKHEEQELKKQEEQELRYLRSTWWIYTHSISRMTAWIMLYVPKYRPYFGFTYGIKTFLYGLLPVFPRTIDMGGVIGREMGMNSGGLSFGLFGMGYCCYGFIGGYFYCCFLEY
jgi:hypothetical protein